MRIHYRSEGGFAYFPGLAKTVTVDSTALPHDDAEKLRQLLDDVNFFELPRVVGDQHPSAADLRRYTITVREGRRSHTIHTIDPVDDDRLRELIDYLNGVCD
jgi:hypothetical protein